MISEAVALRGTPRPQWSIAQGLWRFLAFNRLNRVFERARDIPFDDDARFVFFSDCHRGNNGPEDVFVRNKEIFVQALMHYYQEGYTYIEVGDGDELWKSWSFRDIRRAHGGVFELLHRFDRDDRLHLVVGNHDIGSGRRDRVVKDGIVAREGLVLHHRRSGQRIFVVHGHQADLYSERFFLLSRFAVRKLPLRWRLRTLGVSREAEKLHKQGRIERVLIEWAATYRQMVICGHTHRPTFAVDAAAPYFNTGSCLYPGYITGLEIQGGQIAIVRWVIRPGNDGRRRIERERLLPRARIDRFDRRPSPRRVHARSKN